MIAAAAAAGSIKDSQVMMLGRWKRVAMHLSGYPNSARSSQLNLPTHAAYRAIRKRDLPTA